MASESRAAERLRRELQDPLLAASHPVSRPLLWALLLSLVAAIAWFASRSCRKDFAAAGGWDRSTMPAAIH